MWWNYIFLIVSFLISAKLIMCEELLFVGSYTNEIRTYRLTEQMGLEEIGVSEAGENPSWVVLSRSKALLFAVNEVNDYGGYSGAVSSFSIGESGKLTLISRVSSGGGSPAHLAVDDTDSFLYVSNYCSGSLAVIAVNVDGTLEQPCQIVHHKEPSTCDIDGSAHVHEVTFGSNGTILVNDLGLDQVYVYALTSNGLLATPAISITTSSTTGAGPRHSLIHPNQRFVFVINELVSTMSTYVYDPASGSLGKEVNVVSTLRPEESATDMAAAELQISSCGRFLYASNRDISSPNLNRSSIVVFEVNDASGELKALQHVDTLGEHPRHFNFFLNETILLVGNMNSNTIVTFMVDKNTGLLSPADGYASSIQSPSPTHLVRFR